VAAVGRDFAQCDDGVEASGAAGGVVDGAAEAAAFSDFQHSGTSGASCAENRATVGDDGAKEHGVAGGGKAATRLRLNQGNPRPFSLSTDLHALFPANRSKSASGGQPTHGKTRRVTAI
jgi:hypothetical protein